jgi:hypothetical protein
MNVNETWRDLFRMALLELGPDELRHKIYVAEKAIQLRLEGHRRDDSSSEEERRALDDARRGLRVLNVSELKSSDSIPSILTQKQATS